MENRREHRIIVFLTASLRLMEESSRRNCSLAFIKLTGIRRPWKLYFSEIGRSAGFYQIGPKISASMFSVLPLKIEKFLLISTVLIELKSWKDEHFFNTAVRNSKSGTGFPIWSIRQTSTVQRVLPTYELNSWRTFRNTGYLCRLLRPFLPNKQKKSYRLSCAMIAQRAQRICPK